MTSKVINMIKCECDVNAFGNFLISEAQEELENI